MRFECSDSIIDNQLDISAFSVLLENNDQGYKIYWLEAILELSLQSDDLSFDHLTDKMISLAWFSSTHYHLRLGHPVRGNAVNNLEKAIRLLNEKCPELKEDSTVNETDILLAIKKHHDLLAGVKNDLCSYVPYRLLSPFFYSPGLEEGLAYIKNKSNGQLINYMLHLPEKANILYTIRNGERLEKRVDLNIHWRKFLLQNYKYVKEWIRLTKIEYLEAMNPRVPDIINKLEKEPNDFRKLEDVRNLWLLASSCSGVEIKDIYTYKTIAPESLLMDHFVPWAFVANDELWNLIPTDRDLHANKNNKLPDWSFFDTFAEYQYMLYKLIFPNDETEQNKLLLDAFKRCENINCKSDESRKLYMAGHSKAEFIELLKEVVWKAYHDAEMMGYEPWIIDFEKIYLSK